MSDLEELRYLYLVKLPTVLKELVVAIKDLIHVLKIARTVRKSQNYKD